MKNPHTITLALTGASGMPYGIRLLEMLLQGGKPVSYTHLKGVLSIAITSIAR